MASQIRRPLAGQIASATSPDELEKDRSFGRCAAAPRRATLPGSVKRGRWPPPCHRSRERPRSRAMIEGPASPEVLEGAAREATWPGRAVVLVTILAVALILGLALLVA